MADIVEKLRGTLPVCPFDRRSPDYWTAGEGGKPCHVCGTTEDGPDKCRGADTRCMDEAATTITALRDRVAEVELERDEAREDRQRWFDTHTAHRQACDALGKANAEMFKRAYEAERKTDQALANLERVRNIALAAEARATAAEAAIAHLRDEVIEECARVADGMTRDGETMPLAQRIAIALRALKDTHHETR